MADELKTSEKSTPKTGPVSAPSKSFMTAGPTLHYSHSNVLWFWGFSVFVFFLTCYFWNLLLPLSLDVESTGSLLPDLKSLLQVLNFRLAEIVKEPISIYEYPWYIVVLGVLMGTLAVIPVLVSQLLSFRFSIPLILSIVFVAKLPLLGVFVLISCIAVACRPLRFRSRFISLALCMAPELIYWAIWGGDRTADPVRWGGSFAPWIYAWLSGLAMAGIVLGIGHFTRYKPGLNWLINLVTLLIAFGVFQRHIGFAELDYHRYIADNNPEDVIEFRDQPISDTLDRVIEDAPLRSRLEGRFYSVDKDFVFRKELKEDIHDLLENNLWPEWFRRKMPDELKYQIKRQSLNAQYDKFIERWPGNEKRMPTVLYYKALLSELHPDLRKIVDREILSFYSDYPFEDNYINWKELFDNFPESPESLEARWRIAMHHAGKGQFDKAGEYCQTALTRISELIKRESKAPAEDDNSILTAFRRVPKAAVTPFQLRDLEIRFRRLQSLISAENRGGDEEAGIRLAEFIKLNPYESNYPVLLDRLLERMPPDDGLRDNILFEKAALVDDIQQRAQLLEQLWKQYPQRDAGLHAQYELGVLKIQIWKTVEKSEEAKRKLLADAYAILADVIRQHSDSAFAEQAAAMLQTLPSLE